MCAFPSKSSSQISKSKIDNSKCRVLWLIAIALVAMSTLVSAQQPKKIPRVGYLSASSASEALVRTNAFRQGLRDFGYVEGKNLIVELRYADGKFDRLPTLAAELVAAPGRRHRQRGSFGDQPCQKSDQRYPDRHDER